MGCRWWNPANWANGPSIWLYPSTIVLVCMYILLFQINSSHIRYINWFTSMRCVLWNVFCKQWCALEKWNYCRWTMNNHVLIGRAILVDAEHFDMYVTVCTHRFADDSVCYQTWSHSWRSPRTIERVTWTRHPKRSAAELQGNPIFICQCNNPGGDVHWEGATPKV